MRSDGTSSGLNQPAPQTDLDAMVVQSAFGANGMALGDAIVKAKSGEDAGAIGGWLIGSGSTIICVTMGEPPAVARAMQKQLPDSDVKILMADNEGFRINGS